MPASSGWRKFRPVLGNWPAGSAFTGEAPVGEASVAPAEPLAVVGVAAEHPAVATVEVVVGFSSVVDVVGVDVVVVPVPSPPATVVEVVLVEVDVVVDPSAVVVVGRVVDVVDEDVGALAALVVVVGEGHGVDAVAVALAVVLVLLVVWSAAPAADMDAAPAPTANRTAAHLATFFPIGSPSRRPSAVRVEASPGRRTGDVGERKAGRIHLLSSSGRRGYC